MLPPHPRRIAVRSLGDAGLAGPHLGLGRLDLRFAFPLDLALLQMRLGLAELLTRRFQLGKDG